MITHQSLDHLPYIDVAITGEEQQNVESLIFQELAHQESLRSRGSSSLHPTHHHPLVDMVVPFPETASPSSVALKEIERYEQEHDQEEPDHIFSDGIDVVRYDVEYDNGNARYYESLYYALNETDNLNSVLQNAGQMAQVNAQHAEEVSRLHHQLESVLEKKRRQEHEVNSVRKKRQADFKPVNDYLNSRWKEGIKGVVDLSVDVVTKRD
ncbi:hypothetical protein PSN45_004989 [Yamadazyma tenuis]|uniref:Breast carcinoma amplified sequence 2 n=1 Tax=Candida tenuis (strain ATCC 10573 / BCRC 21748 / CBS 615 / JCM 9827 / NBRC 10315 / NRRL Y-1498 / VKM Y-70) TaxID=590646 RepID=G3B2D9_CANTC|nr:uncharacterized protein CANTEDRAFT_113433 [Yamadazyma tenuis ATCC 10573]EGV64650.1 hypothetical protein CANTEDRAFT_113433 [Yamadazyma tenuis ATCC 10573]WEJ97438.1 hypothetical protein PSN45_004989 [Yamadazyma tenuis]